MKKITYQISIYPGFGKTEKETVTGYQVSPYLAVRVGTFTVDHLPTGMRLMNNSRTLRGAVAYAKKLQEICGDRLSITDTQSEEYTDLLELVREHRGELEALRGV